MFCFFPDGPVSLAIEPKKDYYFPGEYVNIAVDSKPAPDHFRWVDNSTGNELGSRRSLMLTEAMIGNQSLLVSACNTMPDTEHSICIEQRFYVIVRGKSTRIIAPFEHRIIAITSVKFQVRLFTVNVNTLCSLVNIGMHRVLYDAEGDVI